MRLKSRIDVITNSSSEVFVFRGIKDLTRFRREIKEITDAPLSEPYRFDWTRHEDYDDFGMDNHFVDTTDIEKARDALGRILEKDLRLTLHKDTTRFNVEFREYHKLFKKFKKSGLPPQEFLKKYTDQEIIKYWSSGEPRSYFHLSGAVICGLGDDEYISWDDIDKILDKYKNSEHIRLS